MIVEAIKRALERMDMRYCALSQIDHAADPEPIEYSKYLERPFAYEFYHQFRKLLDEGKLELGSSVIQGEVDKRYQHLFEDGRVPDFILHTPNCRTQNLAVIEFKLASVSSEQLVHDFQKLVEFKRVLKYEHVIEVVIGRTLPMKRAWKNIDSLSSSSGEAIRVFGYDVEREGARVVDRTVLYGSNDVNPLASI